MKSQKESSKNERIQSWKKIVGNNGAVWNIEKKYVQATNQETYSIMY